MRAVITTDTGTFIKLGDQLIKDFKVPKLPKVKPLDLTPRKPKGWKKKTKYYKRARRKMARGFQ